MLQVFRAQICNRRTHTHTDTHTTLGLVVRGKPQLSLYGRTVLLKHRPDAPRNAFINAFCACTLAHMSKLKHATIHSLPDHDCCLRKHPSCEQTSLRRVSKSVLSKFDFATKTQTTLLLTSQRRSNKYDLARTPSPSCCLTFCPHTSQHVRVNPEAWLWPAL